jgi:serralysin
MNRDWRLDLDPCRDLDLGQFYDGTKRFSTVDPYASQDDLFVFHATTGVVWRVQSSSYHAPFLLRIYDNAGNAGNATAIDDGNGADGKDYAAFTAPHTGWYYINPSWDQDYYDTYDHTDHRHGGARHLVQHARQ